MNNIIDTLNQIQVQIEQLERARDQHLEDAKNAKDLAEMTEAEIKALKDKAQLATDVLTACDEERRALRDEICEAVNSMHDQAVTEGQDGKIFRMCVEEFAAKFKIPLLKGAEEEGEEEEDAA